jgi:hypothetical protein
VGFVASADGGACCAWPLLVRWKAEEGTRKARQSRERREDEEDHKQEQEYLKSQNDPHGLKWGEGKPPLRKKKESRKDCQAGGREG